MRNQNTGETLGILKKKKAVDGARESLNTSHTHKKEEAGNLFPSPFPFQSKPICSMGTRKPDPNKRRPALLRRLLLKRWRCEREGDNK